MRRLAFILLHLFVFSLPWMEAGSIRGSETLTRMLGILVLGVAVLALLTDGKIARPSVFLATVVLFAMWELATYFWSVEPGMTLSRVVTLAQIIGMIWLIGELADSEARRFSLMQAYVFGCLMLCAFLIQSYISGKPLEGYRYALENFSLNVSADMLAVGIVLAFMLLTRGTRARFFWLNVLYVPLAVFSVVLTASRSGFVATCIALAGTFFLLKAVRPAYRLLWILVIVATFTGFFFAIAGSQNLAKNLERITFSSETQSLSTLTGRTIIWSAGLTVFKQHPLAGIGAGTFRQGVADFLDRARAPHNLFVSIAVEDGIVGLILIVAVLFSALWPAWRAPPDTRGLCFVLFAVLMVLASVANVDTNKVMWLGLTLLSLSGSIFRRTSETPARELTYIKADTAA